jgi:predicted transposase/invertase (TIGR01784 family)
MAMAKDILPPKSDIVFKLLFGDPRNIDLLSDFLKSVLRTDDKDLREIAIVDPHLICKYPDNKLGILDLKAKTKSGKIIHIEIQLSDFPQMPERIVFYGAGLITEQISSGDEYRLLKRVISIIILDYCLLRDNPHYHNRFTLYDPESATELTDLIEINTLELPKLPPIADNYLWNWLRFLSAESREDLDMVAQTSPPIKKAVGKLLELSQDERTRMLFEAREKERRDNAAREFGAYEKGSAEGIIKGRIEGKAEGGIEIAQKLLRRHMSIDDIVAITDLPREQVEQLFAEMESAAE